MRQRLRIPSVYNVEGALRCVSNFYLVDHFSRIPSGEGRRGHGGLDVTLTGLTI